MQFRRLFIIGFLVISSILSTSVLAQYTSQPAVNLQSPRVTGTVETGRIVLRWQVINDSRLQGYKVVVSKYTPNPRYPENGYLFWITDRNQTTAFIDNRSAYNGGDFGGYLTSGQSYYFSVTALYDGGKAAGNSLLLRFSGGTSVSYQPSASFPAPKVSGIVDGNRIILRWQEISDSRFQGYKVVISKHSPNPSYPENGYLYYITNRSQTLALIDNSDSYNSGDFGGYLSPGQVYYFSVTALYEGGKTVGNTIQLKFPGTAAPGYSAVPGLGAPKVSGWVDGRKVVLTWTAITDPKFQGYKVVISKHSPNPRYPENGYLYFITDPGRNYAIIDNGNPYQGGDFGSYLLPGESYYFSITAVYASGNVPGNVIQLKFP